MMSGTFASLKVPDYRRYIGAQLGANMGLWMQRVAQDWLVLQITGSSGVAIGFVTALQFLPFLVVAPWAGVLADRVSRQVVLVFTKSILIALSVAMAVLVATNSMTTTWIYVFALLSGVAAAIDSPARQAILGDVVGQENLVNGVALNSVAFNISRILGPALAGVFIALWGTSEVFVITALLFGLSLVLLATMKSITHPRDHAAAQGHGKPTLGQGLKFIGRDSTMLFCMLALFIVASFNLNFQLTTALMSTVEFGGDAAAFGILTTILSLGSLLGSLLAARRTSIRIRLVVAAAVMLGLVSILAGTMPTRLTYALALPLCGLFAMTFTTSVQSYIQVRTPAHMRGRVMGIYTVVFFAGTPVGAPLIGWASDHLGPRIGLIGGGALSVAGILILVVWLMRRMRRSVSSI
jgi:MFS family permease